MEASRTFGRVETWESSPLLAPRTAQEVHASLRAAKGSRPSTRPGTIPSSSGRTVYVLADADTFYASCERVFHPELAHAPVVVLSNNDGCVVTRTTEAKPFVPKGAPWFQIREEATERGAVARSSNYELYGSLSARMMAVMRQYFSHQEVYSIDECFLVSHAPIGTVIAQARRMREAVWKGVGIPVSIGVAPTKTLAKIVNHEAKHGHGHAHLDCWGSLSRQEQEKVLAATPVSDVWGIGRRLTKRLAGLGILTALQLRDSDPVEMRHRFSVFVQRTVLELRGVPCVSEESDADEGARKDMIMCTRMFSHPVRGRDVLCQALAVYAQEACRRLRRQKSLAGSVGIFAGVSPFHPQDSGLSLPLTVGTLPEPTDDPLAIVRFICHHLLGRVNPRTRFVRAGILLTGLVPAADYHPLPPFSPKRDTAGIGSLLDRMTLRYGDHCVGIGYAGLRGKGRGSNDIGADWNMKRGMLSNRATTRWSEMPVVHAD